MARSRVTLVVVLCALGVGVHTAAAQAKLTVTSLRGSMSIAQTYCAPGIDPASGCSIAHMTVAYTSVRVPAQQPAAGRGEFTRGIRVTATGNGQCTAESPPVTIVGPDGSIQLLGGAERLDPVRTRTTVVLLERHATRTRFAWLEPLAPAFKCRHLGDPIDAIAVPVPGTTVPRDLTSVSVGPRTLQRPTFVVVIKGRSTWDNRTPAGATVRGASSWRIRVRFRNVQATGTPSFAG